MGQLMSLVLIEHASSRSLKTHAQLASGADKYHFSMDLHLLPAFVCATARAQTSLPISTYSPKPSLKGIMVLSVNNM